MKQLTHSFQLLVHFMTTLWQKSTIYMAVFPNLVSLIESCKLFDVMMPKPSSKIGIQTIRLCSINPPIILKCLFEQNYAFLVFENLAIDLRHNQQKLPNRMQHLVIFAKSYSDRWEIEACLFCTCLKERGSDEKKCLYHYTGIIVYLFLGYPAFIIDGKAQQFEINYIIKCVQ